MSRRIDKHSGLAATVAVSAILLTSLAGALGVGAQAPRASTATPAATPGTSTTPGTATTPAKRPPYIPPNKSWAMSRASTRTVQPEEYRATNLQSEVALPNLPGYTGKQVFVQGLMYPNAKEGPGYYLTYNTEHTQQQVKEWWTNALKMDPWKITYTDTNTIKAHAKDGSKCSIVAGTLVGGAPPEKQKGMHGSYSVYYHVVQRR